jgi:hypothetical protein
MPRVPEELLDEIPEEVRDLFQQPRRRRSFAEEANGYPDENILALVRQDALWLGTAPVLDRIQRHQELIRSDHKTMRAEGTAFMKDIARALINPQQAEGRPIWYDKRLLERLARALQSQATRTQAT